MLALEGHGRGSVLAIDDGGVHVRMYSNRHDARPAVVDESKLHLAGFDRSPGEDIGVGHLPMSHKTFKAHKPVFIQQSRVAPEELEGYEMWREAEGGYF